MMIELKHNNVKSQIDFCQSPFFPFRVFFVFFSFCCYFTPTVFDTCLSQRLVFLDRGEDDLDMWVMIVY